MDLPFLEWRSWCFFGCGKLDTSRHSPSWKLLGCLFKVPQSEFDQRQYGQYVLKPFQFCDIIGTTLVSSNDHLLCLKPIMAWISTYQSYLYGSHSRYQYLPEVGGEQLSSTLPHCLSLHVIAHPIEETVRQFGFQELLGPGLELVKECFNLGRLLKFSAVGRFHFDWHTHTQKHLNASFFCVAYLAWPVVRILNWICSEQTRFLASELLSGVMFGCGAVFSFLAQDALSPGSCLDENGSICCSWNAILTHCTAHLFLHNQKLILPKMMCWRNLSAGAFSMSQHVSAAPHLDFLHCAGPRLCALRAAAWPNRTILVDARETSWDTVRP